MISNIFNKNYTSSPSFIKRTNSNEAEDISTTLLEYMINVEEDYFNIVKENKQTAYIGMKLQNAEVVTEGMKDFKDKVVKFFQGLIDKIKEIFNKFMMRLKATFGDFSKFIEKYRTQINNANPDFNIDGFMYSFDGKDDIPKLDKINDIVSSFNQDLKSMDKLTLNDVNDERAKWNEKDNLDKARGHICGFNKEIEADEYTDKVKSLFRGDSSTKFNMHIGKSQLDNAVKDYESLKKIIPKVKSEYQKIDSLLRNIKKFFEAKTYNTYVGKDRVIQGQDISVDDNKLKTGEKVNVEYNGDNLLKLNTFYEFKFKQTKDISTMILTVYIEKINAMEEALSFYKKIIKRSVFNGKETDDKNEDKED